MDLDVCLIIVISKCIGGDLVLLEPGLVLEQRNGDAMVFPLASGDISHYNMNFVGFCASIVFHSDCASETWTGSSSYISEMSTTTSRGKYLTDRNGWGKNIYFCRSWISPMVFIVATTTTWTNKQWTKTSKNVSLLYSFYATPRNTSASLKKTMLRKTKNSMANSKATSTDIPSSSKRQWYVVAA